MRSAFDEVKEQCSRGYFCRMTNWRQILSWRTTTWIVTVEDQWSGFDTNPRKYKIPANTPLQAAQKAAVREGYSIRKVKVLNREENAYEVSDALVIQVSSMEDIEELD